MKFRLTAVTFIISASLASCQLRGDRKWIDPSVQGRELANTSKKVDICHYDPKLGQFRKISVLQNALKTHIGKHGPANGYKDMEVSDANELEGSNNCECMSGYIGDGLNCVDINECDPNPCVHGVCTDTGPNSYSCTCEVGWTDTNCDIDECVAICGDTSNYTAFSDTLDLIRAIQLRHLDVTKVKYGPTVNCWNVSQITDMTQVFYSNPDFDEDIFCWDVSNVTNMEFLFYGAKFNHKLAPWNVSSVITMDYMFYASSFNQELDPWDVSSVTRMLVMFAKSPFNQPLASWNVSSVTTMSAMFGYSPFNQPLASWDVSSVTTMDRMFVDSPFNQSLASWNVSRVTDMSAMFAYSSFNQSLASWDVSSATKMYNLFFSDTAFNQDLCSWGPKLQNAYDVSNMFSGTSCVNQTDPNLALYPPTPLCFNCEEPGGARNL